MSKIGLKFLNLGYFIFKFMKNIEKNLFFIQKKLKPKKTLKNLKTLQKLKKISNFPMRKSTNLTESQPSPFESHDNSFDHSEVISTR